MSNGQGLPYDVGTGKPMKDWVKFSVAMKDSWIEYCDESKMYILGGYSTTKLTD
ncbi:MAG: hypothetical protein GPJ54_01390 [Candidatus Heimdallarchaeota archaeon]|nr:hypothetical protein [Candidatus Heimdallarchaeota archaeon]